MLIDLAPDTESIQPALRRALRDEDSDVAGDAARALGALRERASSSVPALVMTLAHENPYVRIYAAEALASIGPKASAATRELATALRDPIPGVRWAAANYPAMRYEAEWALNRIAGIESAKPVVSSHVPSPSIALQSQTPVTQTGNPPVNWGATTGRNILWSVELGNEVYGRPVVGGDVSMWAPILPGK